MITRTELEEADKRRESMSTVQRFYALLLAKQRNAATAEERERIANAITAVEELYPDEVAKWQQTFGEDT